MTDTRLERDSLGEVAVPADALYGAQTQRAIDNFRIAGRPLPTAMIDAIIAIKRAAALTNAELGLLDATIAGAIVASADALLTGAYADQFPVDVYQTGSGTSSNMNVNEVLARLASQRCGQPVHPNDHVNFGQSSNDVIPSALLLSAARQLHRELLPALEQLAALIDQRGRELAAVVKTGRTHLMDALPIRFDQELSGWRAQLLTAEERLEDCLDRLCELPLGGTAIGTGVNSHAEFGARAIASLSERSGLPLRPARNRFAQIAGIDAAVELSAQLRGAALVLVKIANDLRWMNSGPQSGLGEIRLAALQPGSSIMPGKVNPVIPEAVAMAATQCVGLDAAVALAGQSGNFQLNVMLPLVADNLLTMIGLLARAATALAGRGGLLDFEVNVGQLAEQAARNPILATALAPLIGYDRAAAIAKKAIAEGRAILDVAVEMSGIDRAELQKLLDPVRLTEGGLQLPGAGGG
jgi:fumarate hydratase class II